MTEQGPVPPLLSGPNNLLPIYRLQCLGLIRSGLHPADTLTLPVTEPSFPSR